MSWTEEQYHDFINKHSSRRPIGLGKPKAKYYAKKVEKYGRLWDSKKELREYEKLLDLKEAGEIKAIELQPKFELQPAFRYQGKAQRAITYKADFKVTYSDGRIEIIEVKGFKTRDYAMRKKIFLFLHPDVDFKEIL